MSSIRTMPAWEDWLGIHWVYRRIGREPEFDARNSPAAFVPHCRCDISGHLCAGVRISPSRRVKQAFPNVYTKHDVLAADVLRMSNFD